MPSAADFLDAKEPDTQIKAGQSAADFLDEGEPSIASQVAAKAKDIASGIPGALTHAVTAVGRIPGTLADLAVAGVNAADPYKNLRAQAGVPQIPLPTTTDAYQEGPEKSFAASEAMADSLKTANMQATDAAIKQQTDAAHAENADKPWYKRLPENLYADVKATVTNPSALPAALVEQGVPLLTAGAIGKIAAAGDVAEAATLARTTEAMKSAVTATGERKFGDSFIKAMADHHADVLKSAKLKSKIGMAGAFGAETGASSAQQFRNSVQTMPDDKLQSASPRYASLRKTLSEDAAKAAIVADGLPYVEAIGTAAGTAGGLAFPGEEAGRIAATAGTEATLTAQGAATQIAQNAAARASGLDPNRKLTEGVEDAATSAAAAALPFAGVAAAAHGGAKPVAPVEVTPDAPEKTGGDADLDSDATEPPPPPPPNPTAARIAELDAKIAAEPNKHVKAVLTKQRKEVQAAADADGADVEKQAGALRLQQMAVDALKGGDKETHDRYMVEAEKLNPTAAPAASAGIEVAEIQPDNATAAPPPEEEPETIPETDISEPEPQKALPAPSAIPVTPEGQADTPPSPPPARTPIPSSDTGLTPDVAAAGARHPGAAQDIPPPPEGFDVGKSVGLGGGKSRNGKVGYISRMIPQFLSVKNRNGQMVRIPVHEEIAAHENAEHPNIEEKGYDKAHTDDGNAATRKFLDRYNVDPVVYGNTLRPHIKAAELDALQNPDNVPRDLDPRPYAKPTSEVDRTHQLGEQHPWNKLHAGAKVKAARAAALEANLKEHNDGRNSDATEPASERVSGQRAVHEEAAEGSGTATEQRGAAAPAGEVADAAGAGEEGNTGESSRTQERPASQEDGGQARGEESAPDRRSDSDAKSPRGRKPRRVQAGGKVNAADEGASRDGSEPVADGAGAEAAATGRAEGSGGTADEGSAEAGGTPPDYLSKMSPDKLRSYARGWGLKDVANRTPESLAAEIRTKRGPDAPAPNFKRDATVRTGMLPETVSRVVKVLTQHWRNAPNIKIIRSMDEASPRVREEYLKQQAAGAKGEPVAWYHNGELTINASAMRDTRHVIQSLFHEALGHHGLQSVFGEDFHGILDSVAKLNESDVRAAADEYGLDYDTLSDRRRAAEEVLAKLAETNPKSPLVVRAMAAIRTWLRKYVPGFGGMKFSNDELIRNFIVPARRFVESGVKRESLSDRPAFSRSASPAPTSIKNETTDRERSERGIAPAEQAASRDFGTVWDEAKATPYHEQVSLVESLKRNPRPITDKEDAILLHQQIGLQNAHDAVNKAVIKAYSDGDMGALAEHRATASRILDELADLYDVNRAAGTENARGLNARKILANSDYSLAAMTSRMREAVGGRKLTEPETKKVEDAQEKIKEAQKAEDAHADKAVPAEEVNRRNLEAEHDKLAAELPESDNKAGTAGKIIRNRVRAGDTPEEAMVAAGDAGATPEEIDAGYKRVRERQKDLSLPEPKPAKQTLLDSYKNRLRARIADLQKQLDAGEKNPPKGRNKMELDSEAAALKSERDRLSAEFNKVFKEPMSDEARLSLVKKSAIKRALDYEARTAAKDFAVKQRKPVSLDAEALKLKAKTADAKLAFDRAAMMERLNARSSPERLIDLIPKWERMSLLSSPATLGKLFFAAASRVALAPAREGIGAAWGVIPGIKQIAKGAPREGGLNLKAEGKALSSLLTTGLQDAKQTLLHGHSDLDVLYGGKRDIMPFEKYMGFFGRVHGMEKSPVKRAEFERSLEKRTTYAAANGVDVTDPMVQMRLGVEAYKDARRAVFMQDNWLSSAFERAVRSLDPDQATNKVDRLGRSVATAAVRTLLPITKVPTNVAFEVIHHVFGLGEAGVRLGHIVAKGLKEATPEENDLFMRALKDGTVGAIGLTAGYLFANQIGGFWNRQDKDKNHPDFGTLKIGDYKVPALALHNPALETLQMGATIRHALDQVTHGNKNGPLLAAFAAGMGLMEQIPFVDQMLAISSLRDDPEKALRTGIANRIVPAGVQFAAKEMDTNSSGDTVKRDPKTFQQAVEAGIPGLREDVPRKAAK